jgi:hypothetical protein
MMMMMMMTNLRKSVNVLYESWNLELDMILVKRAKTKAESVSKYLSY